MTERFLSHEETYRLVRKYDGKIPSEVTKDYNVLGYECFAFNANIRSINISEGVSTMSTGCFHGCYNLQDVKLPMTLHYIYSRCFYCCSRLREIIIPDSVKEIGAYAFERCTTLNHIEIGKGIKYIGECAFNNTGMEIHRLRDDDGKLITYKAMKSDMTCLGYKYKVGVTHEIPEKDDIVLCECGFHSCYNPFECFNYYSGEYGKDIVMCKCLVDDSNDIDRDEILGKIASRKITILKKFDGYYDVFEDYKKELKKLTDKENTESICKHKKKNSVFAMWKLIKNKIVSCLRTY